MRYNNINGLRAYSAIAILIMHVLTNGNYNLQGFVFDSIIPSFSSFVMLFMIISGFSMCCGYYDKILQNTISVDAFYKKRFKKIWPFFAVLVLIDIIVSPSVNSLYEAFANLTLCFGLLPNARISVIGVGWTLGVIFVFYLLFPFFCFLLKSKRRAWISFAVAIVFNMVCSKYFFDENHVLENFSNRTSFIYCAMFFIAGGIVFLYRNEIRKIVDRFHYVGVILLVAMLLAFWLWRSGSFMMLLLFTLILVISIGKDNVLLNNAFTGFVGDISLEIYLCHMVVYRVIEKLNFIKVFSNDILSYIFVCVLTIVGSILVALLINKGIAIIDIFFKKKLGSFRKS